MKKITSILVLAIFILALGCKGKPTATPETQPVKVVTGAEQLDKYLPLLEGKKVGIMANQTTIVGDKHLVDVLLEKGVDLKFAFIPEHGFRGTIERGEDVHNDVDTQTGLPLYSLYGENHQADSLVSSVDIMIFDIQDVGARFYT